VISAPLRSALLLLCGLCLSAAKHGLAIPQMASSEPTMAPAAIAATPVANATTQTIAPKTVYVHIQQRQQFTSAGATAWKASVGQITSAGLYIAPYTMPASPAVTVTATGPGGSATAMVTLVSGAIQAVSPTSITLAVNGKQQFTSAGATTWEALYGTITSTGLYTAPAVWPAGAGDKITVHGIHGIVTASVTITPPVPTITSLGYGGKIPLGLFTFNVYGTNFSPGSQAVLFGSTVPTTYSAGVLTVFGFRAKPIVTTITIINKTAVSKPFPIQIGLTASTVSPAAARRLLQQAAFGPSPNDAQRVQTLGIKGWINEQLNMAQSSTYSGITQSQGGMPEHFLTDAVIKPDQLRQRVAFALSQIFVTSLNRLVFNDNMVIYQNMLLADAFSNYRKIMSDVTTSAAMGQYLDMGNNAKADPTQGTLANENFAREMMQLFTLGTVLLNPDGSVQYDSNQLPIPTYSQFTVTEFARVYTGWTYHPAPGKAVQWNTYVNAYGPMVSYAPQHDSGSKQLLNGYVSPAGVTPAVDLGNALNNIFNHPNICPFVSKQLIQHLVKSNPSPAYVGRVAAVFKNNGSGVRGDMKAVITAILMDPEARANDEGLSDKPTDGHLQEPVLFIAGMVRAFGGHMDDRNYYHYELGDLGQNIYSSPSVFNYYAPDFMVPGTSLEGGEFQIDSPNNAILRANEVDNIFRQYNNPIQSYGPGTTIDLSAFIPLASTPVHLVDALDFTLTRGVMPAEMKSAIVTAVTGETGGNLRRVQRACFLILSSSYYNVWH